MGAWRHKALAVPFLVFQIFIGVWLMRTFWISFSRSLGTGCIVVAMFLGTSLYADDGGLGAGIVCGQWDSATAKCIRNNAVCPSGTVCVWVSYPGSNPCECL
jgi:hypothetical protein